MHYLPVNAPSLQSKGRDDNLGQPDTAKPGDLQLITRCTMSLKPGRVQSASMEIEKKKKKKGKKKWVHGSIVLGDTKKEDLAMSGEGHDLVNDCV